MDTEPEYRTIETVWDGEGLTIRIVGLPDVEIITSALALDDGSTQLSLSVMAPTSVKLAAIKRNTDLSHSAHVMALIPATTSNRH